MPKATKEEPLPKSIDELKAQIDNRYGAGSIMAADEVDMSVDVIPTGSLDLDRKLGVGGIPRGRITEIFGTESGGKTTLALHVVAEAQAMGEVCGYVDAEHSLDPTYAAAIGVDMSKLLISQPDNGEEALGIVSRLAKSGLVGLVVVDSVDALVPLAAIKGEIGDANVGALPRLMSQGLRYITASASNTNTAIIFINQIREKIGVMFGSPETTPGGRALKFYSSVRLDVRRESTNKDGEDAVSNTTKIKVVKNKVAAPYKVAHFDIVFGKGIDRYDDLLDVGEDTGVLVKSGNTWSYEGLKLGVGKGQAAASLREDPHTAELVRKSIREVLWGDR